MSRQFQTLDVNGRLKTSGSSSGSGDVVGPGGAVNDRIVTFNGTTGKLVKDSGTLLAALAALAGTNAFTGANSFATNPLDLLVGQIKFPTTQNASSNANTLDDYEEGTWTPIDSSGAGLVLAIGSAAYVKIGRAIFLYYQITYPATANGANAAIGGLPFTSGVDSAAYVGYCTEPTLFAGSVGTGGVVITPRVAGGAIITNNILSNDTLRMAMGYAI